MFQVELRLDCNKPQHFIQKLGWTESSRNHESLAWCSREIFLNSNLSRSCFVVMKAGSTAPFPGGLARSEHAQGSRWAAWMSGSGSQGLRHCPAGALGQPCPIPLFISFPVTIMMGRTGLDTCCGTRANCSSRKV